MSEWLITMFIALVYFSPLYIYIWRAGRKGKKDLAKTKAECDKSKRLYLNPHRPVEGSTTMKWVDCPLCTQSMTWPVGPDHVDEPCIQCSRRITRRDVADFADKVKAEIAKKAPGVTEIYHKTENIIKIIDQVKGGE